MSQTILLYSIEYQKILSWDPHTTYNRFSLLLNAKAFIYLFIYFYHDYKAKY